MDEFQPLDLDAILEIKDSTDIEISDKDLDFVSCNKLSFAGASTFSMVAWYKAGET